MSAQKTWPQPAMTFADLKAVIDTFTPEQLAMPVCWCGEERGGPVQCVEVLTEEHVVVDDRDGMEPASAYADDPEAQAEITARWPAGTPLLSTDDTVTVRVGDVWLDSHLGVSMQVVSLNDDGAVMRFLDGTTANTPTWEWPVFERARIASRGPTNLARGGV